MARATRDLFEYLVGRYREGTLSTDVPGRGPGKVAYQIPCHLRAQNIGFKTRDVLQLVPGTTVRVVEKCTAMDGTWAMKKENYALSLGYARKVAGRDGGRPRPTPSPRTARSRRCRSRQCGARSRAHPTRLLREAYGLPEEH